MESVNRQMEDATINYKGASAVFMTLNGFKNSNFRVLLNVISGRYETLMSSTIHN